MKAMLSLPVLVAVACSGGGGTGGTSGSESGGGSGFGEVVTIDAVSTGAVSTSASTSAAGTTDTDTNVGATGSSTTGTSTGAAAVGTTTSSTISASASATDSGAVTSGPSATTGAVTNGTTGSTPGDGTLSFATDIFPLWEMVREPAWQYRGTGSYSGCNVDGVCHGGASPGAGLMMADAPSTYAELIDMPSASTLCAGTLRVVAGDPEASCLVLFYQGRLGDDDLGWVDDVEIELMREWIRQGALP